MKASDRPAESVNLERFLVVDELPGLGEGSDFAAVHGRMSNTERDVNKFPAYSPSRPVMFADVPSRNVAIRPGGSGQTPLIHKHFGPSRPCEKSCGQLLGESWPRANRSGTGRGGDVTGSRNSMIGVSTQWSVDD